MKDKSERCLDCGKLCSLGTGRYVNRYPVYNEKGEFWRCGVCAEELDFWFEEVSQEEIDEQILKGMEKQKGGNR